MRIHSYDILTSISSYFELSPPTHFSPIFLYACLYLSNACYISCSSYPSFLTFRNMLLLRLGSPSPVITGEKGPPPSAVRNCSFNVFADIPCICMMGKENDREEILAYDGVEYIEEFHKKRTKKGSCWKWWRRYHDAAVLRTSCSWLSVTERAKLWVITLYRAEGSACIF